MCRDKDRDGERKRRSERKTERECARDGEGGASERETVRGVGGEGECMHARAHTHKYTNSLPLRRVYTNARAHTHTHTHTHTKEVPRPNFEFI